MLAAVVLSGWIDGYYAWNANHPEPHINWFEGVGTAAHRADQPALNVAAIEARLDPKPLGFHVIAGAGDALDVVHAAEPHPKRRPLRNVYQASLSAKARGVVLEAGIYPSHIGFEGFFTKDNWNYTRGWLGEFSPYYQAGVKASYAWTERWSAQVHVLRGWQNIGAHVPAAIGTQIAFNGARTSASINTFGDPHRKFVDLVATYKLTPRFSVGATADRGHDRPENWTGVGAYARYALNDRIAFAGRAEDYRDPHGMMSGTPQTLQSATLTFEYDPAKHVTVKVEGRLDRSTAPVFADRRKQELLLCGISFLLP